MIDNTKDATRSLHRAVEDGDLATAERLLESNPYLVASREDYKLTPLHRAAMAGHADLAAALLERSAQVDARDHGGGTALHAAAARGRLQAAAVLLDKGADANARDQDGLTPLHLAARGGHDAVAALLLARGADPNLTGLYMGAPLHEAAAAGHQGVAARLLAHGALANIRSAGSHTAFTPWHAARDAGQGAIVALLAEHGGQDKGAAAITLHRAAEAGYLGRLKYLIASDPALVASRDFLHRRTPLHWAANSGHLEAVEILLANGADLAAKDKAGDTPLARAEAMGHRELEERLRGDR